MFVFPFTSTSVLLWWPYVRQVACGIVVILTPRICYSSSSSFPSAPKKRANHYPHWIPQANTLPTGLHNLQTNEIFNHCCVGHTGSGRVLKKTLGLGRVVKKTSGLGRVSGTRWALPRTRVFMPHLLSGWSERRIPQILYWEVI